NTHLFWVAANRLAKTLLLANPDPLVASYQVAHGTVRPAPAKSIAGASPSLVWSKFSDPLNGGAVLELPPIVPIPRVVQTPPANEREKIWSFPPEASCWRNTTHGTAAFPAVSAPPTMSALAGSSLLTLSAGSIPA